MTADFVETLGRGPGLSDRLGLSCGAGHRDRAAGLPLTLNPAEVADAFEVPLSFLMDPANHRTGSRIWQGVSRMFFEMPFENRHIWGITAGIVRILYERLYADERAEAAT